jgi:Pilus formation protein N terminal region
MTSALAFVAMLAVGAPVEALTLTVRLSPREEVVLNATEVTAAWAVDPDVVEASLRQGRVTVVGRSAGTTVVSVVRANGVLSYEIAVDPPRRPKAATAGAAGAGQQWTAFQGSYDSSTTLATGSLDVID